jgi:hypothetical protein
MIDELDALRSFRPEATGPTDALQLQERIALMETLAHAPAGRRRRVPRLRPRILLGVAVALVTAVGTAGATGMIPDDVQQALGLAAAHDIAPSLSPQIDQAVERASAPTAGGGTVELWIAPTNGGGTCAYLRQLDAAGAPTDSGPISCAVSIAGGGRMGQTFGQSGSPRPAGGTMMVGGSLGGGRVSAQVEVDASGAATLFGQEPGSVAKVEVVDSAGAVLGEAAANDGWFLLTLSAGAASAAASLVAQSASGASVGTVPITTDVPPPTATTGAGGSMQITSGTAPA